MLNGPPWGFWLAEQIFLKGDLPLTKCTLSNRRFLPIQFTPSLKRSRSPNKASMSKESTCHQKPNANQFELCPCNTQIFSCHTIFSQPGASKLEGSWMANKEYFKKQFVNSTEQNPTKTQHEDIKTDAYKSEGVATKWILSRAAQWLQLIKRKSMLHIIVKTMIKHLCDLYTWTLPSKT